MNINKYVLIVVISLCLHKVQASMIDRSFNNDFQQNGQDDSFFVYTQSHHSSFQNGGHNGSFSDHGRNHQDDGFVKEVKNNYQQDYTHDVQDEADLEDMPVYGKDPKTVNAFLKHQVQQRPRMKYESATREEKLAACSRMLERVQQEKSRENQEKIRVHLEKGKFTYDSNIPIYKQASDLAKVVCEDNYYVATQDALLQLLQFADRQALRYQESGELYESDIWTNNKKRWLKESAPYRYQNWLSIH